MRNQKNPYPEFNDGLTRHHSHKDYLCFFLMKKAPKSDDPISMKKILLFLFVVCCWSCQEDTDPQGIYLHGQIVNPLTDYITLSKDNKLIDTIFLDDQHAFSYRLEKPTEGLYTFVHPPESQSIYMVPGDSILFRLNTLAFDETLYFSGTAAVKNNLLMELFLLNERNNDLIFSYYKINPKTFASITDSILKVRKKMFRKLEKEHQFSDKFSALAEKSILYEFYDLRERYAFLINKYSSHKNKIPPGFFDYRKKVDFNDETLKNHYGYQRFLDNYLKNRSIENCGPRNQNRSCYSLNDFQNLRKRILLTDSLFTLDVLRNRFFQRFGRKQIIFSSNAAQIDSTLNLLSRLGYQEEGLDELRNLAEVQRSYFIGNNISNKKLIDSDLNPLLMAQVLTKPTITFSWTVHSPKNQQKKHEKIQDLRKKYPEINFIGINIDADETQIWKKTLEQNGYDQSKEYQIRDVGSKKVLYKNYLNKVLFINKKGEIVFGDISLDSPNFEGYILEFLNQ